MTVRLVERFQTSDGELFTRENDATAHDTNFVLTRLDKVFQEWQAEEPEYHYPAAKGSLLPFIVRNAAQIVKILNLVDKEK